MLQYCLERNPNPNTSALYEFQSFRRKFAVAFLDGQPAILLAQKAFEKDTTYSGISGEQAGKCVRSLALRCSGQRLFVGFAKSFHPLLWWSAISIERCSLLACSALRVFSLFSSSANVERTLKVHSRT